jgi:hypothetical protein
MAGFVMAGRGIVMAVFVMASLWWKCLSTVRLGISGCCDGSVCDGEFVIAGRMFVMPVFVMASLWKVRFGYSGYL